jgi:NAD(P)-dependent dehydrogenase (short-subunit alcohol dehydrogenase family)
MDALNLSGRVALVSGGSRGIGQAIATGLAKQGATVVAFSRTAELTEQKFPSDNGAKPGLVLTLPADSTDPQAIGQLVEEVLKRFGRLDILVNNTGGVPFFGPMLKASLDDWDASFEVNLRSAFILTKKVVESWMGANGGNIINVASIAGLRGRAAGLGIYGVTKAGLLMFTKRLATELAPNRIRANAVAPGFVKTEFSRELWENPKLLETILASTPSGRLGTVEDVARAVTFLASEASSYINGEVLTIDGGTLA